MSANRILFLTIATFFYIILLFFVYIFKKKINSLENKLYTSLLIISIVSFISEISLAFFYSKSDLLLNIFMRLYLFCIVLWISIIFLYLITILYQDFIPKRLKIIKILYFILFFVLFIFIVALSINYHVEEGILMYSFGPAVNFAFIVGGIFIGLIYVLLLFNIKIVKEKKFFPIILFVTLITISTIIQKIYPACLFINFVFGLTISLMNHTIENPDLKLLAQLNIAKEQADKANHAKTEFLSSMSHEIRTPLNAIVGFSEILDTEDIPPSSKELVNDILSASDSLIEIVNGILDISKIEANKFEIVNTEYEFKKIFNDMVTLTKGRLGDKPLEFRYKYDETIPSFLYGDAVRLKQIVINLLTNSVKYTQHGYIELKVNSVINRNVCRLIISVEDSGIGIKPESINKLFSKFERLDVEKNASIEGTGLGLAITKKLVELMNGKIVVQSKYGEGSKFTVAIDQKVITTRQATEEKSESVVIDIHNKKVLVVDDNALNIKVACRLLSGYSIINEGVASGQECIDKINNNEKFDLILLDDMMPKMSGTETFKKLREDVNFNTPVVILTANAISGMREKYIASGFDDYLAKPIEKLELERVIKKYLS